ncbi:chromosomal replication initiator protein DnaA [Labrys miyagiensis]|uniref:Chromosomal replication initiator protein DnaA n=1 Tax=Labrys miyagiensis TaxID=346912 RepID=A0ABQ6CUK4_9HYPH|nr:chromosomal replication initiator protein DnaA [Labrys miyagiensis]GLS23359.1 chromosomal replication initiator protein DnaA [Labrys miyagiensis]
MNSSERLTLSAAAQNSKNLAVADLSTSLGDAAITPAAAWDRVKRRLRAEYGEDVFSSWFARLELDAVADDTVSLSVPTRFLRSWIQAHYIDKILGLLSAELPGTAHITLNVRTAAARPPIVIRETAPCAKNPAEVVAAKPAMAPFLRALEAPVREDDLAGSPLDRRMSFEAYYVGRSNALAHAAALQVAKSAPSEPLPYNPLFIHASVGLGKSHLIQAIAHQAETQGKRALYLTAERFMYGFVAALKAQTAIQFKEKLRAIDILVIDDLQFLAGKSIQQEFCHTLNALIDGGKQVVVAADRPPADLETLDERVRSRLSGGLVVEIGALDEELRVKILKSRIEAARSHHANFDVPDTVVAYVAHQVSTNGRDLDGAVNRLLAHSALSGSGMSLETAEAAIRDLVKNREPRRVKIEDIQRIVAKHYNVSRADILSLRRTATVVKPRQVAMYLAKSLTPRSLPEIGRRFGGRDHTTVLHAVRKIEGLVGRDSGLAEEVDLLRRLLSE